MNYTRALTQLNSLLTPAQQWWVLEHVTGQTKEKIIIQNYTLSSDEQNKLAQIIVRLQADEPLAYILGTTVFLDLELQVKKPILIPRPETEFFVQQCIEQLAPHSIKTILDLGTGTGCIGLSLARALPGAHVTLSDISHDACTLAQKNAAQNTITNISVVHSDLFKNLTQKFDVLISNPPYIPTSYKDTLEASVIQYEDHHALFAGSDGLDIIQKIIKHAHDHLTDLDAPFKLALEVDASHTQHVVQLCLENKFGHAWIMHDQFDRPRFVFAK